MLVKARLRPSPDIVRRSVALMRRARAVQIRQAGLDMPGSFAYRIQMLDLVPVPGGMVARDPMGHIVGAVGVSGSNDPLQVCLPPLITLALRVQLPSASSSPLA